LAAALLVDKPGGVTSHDVVAAIRRERGGKVGHAGTLDPFATGLLIVLLGRATRLQRFLVALPKTYLATARLGWRSSTGDPDGELTETGRIPARLELPVGELEQRVPMTSAVKVGGERLYEKAHRGEVVETPVRRVTVPRADLVGGGQGTASFEIECSSGTYVRSLIETLEDAYCESLRRTAIGPFTVPTNDAEELDLQTLMQFLPNLQLGPGDARRVSHGRPLELRAALPPGGGLEGVGPQASPTGRSSPLRLSHGDDLLAIAREEDGWLKPEVVLA
jgi:tRNA pseudouridine55 synthase